MEIVVLCACAFFTGMGVEWFRGRGERRLLRQYRKYYEFWHIAPPKKRRHRDR